MRRRVRGAALLVAVVVTCTACSISGAAPAAAPSSTPSTTVSTAAGTPERSGRRQPETSAPITQPDRSETEPVALGMSFGRRERPITVEQASDEVASRPRYRRLRAFRDRVAQVAQELEKGDLLPPERAALTGTATDFGSFTYTYTADGRIQPDPQWISTYIRTEEVPILGEVTCHKQMFPQLRAALEAVVDAGLAHTIRRGEYGGCYVPRFIASDPRNPISLHTWGIALDLNVPGNQRGTVGDIDRTVVAIFKAWGFDWGGDWNYTDPMHFELARLYRP